MGPISIPGYAIERELGVGGMARVYLAIQSSLERRVALKVMAPALAADASFSKRFLREARTIASLTHPHIVAVYEVGVTTDHMHYFSMQYLPGGDFAHRMRKGVEQSEVIRVLAGIAKALGFAHSQGVVHRDVTPGNVMFDSTDTPILTDFGIARALSGTSRITSTGVSIGTSNYMSPEQARGGEIDARSDLYSLGALCFEALTGRPPFQGPDGFAVAYAHVFEPIPRVAPDLQHWQAFLDKALAKDPADRFATADDFIVGIQAVKVGSTAILALPKSDIQQKNSTTTLIENLARQVGPPAPGQIPWARLALVVVLVCGLAAVAYGLWKRPGGVPPPVVAAVTTPVSTAPLVPSLIATTDDPLEVLLPPTDGTDGIDLPADGSLPAEGDPLVAAPAAAEFTVATPQQRIAVFLELGQALLRMQRLQLPQEANATMFFARVLTLDPKNESAKAGLSSVVDAYLTLSDADLNAGRIAEGKDRLDRAKQVSATPGLDTPALKARIEERWNQRLNKLRESARTAMEQWRGDDAKVAIDAVLALEPNDQEMKKWLRESTTIGKPGYRFKDANGPNLLIVGGGSVMLSGARRGGDLRVPIAVNFAVALREVTVAEFSRFVESAKHSVAREGCSNREGGFFSTSRDRNWRKPGFDQGSDHPVVCVSFDDASAYAKWLSQNTGQNYRLLSEAEWQYLASQVKSKPCVSGNRADQSYKKAEGGNGALSCDDGFAMTAPVGKFEATAGGLYDIEGNVREWVADCANDAHAGRKADQLARNGNCGERMIMGSAWHSDNDEAAVVSRRAAKRTWLTNTIGFRVARDLALPSNAQQ